MPSIKDLRELISSYPDDMACAWALWTPPDVVNVMDTRRTADKSFGNLLQPTLDEEEIADILNRVHHYQDATLGITWESLEVELPTAEHRDERLIARLQPGVRIKWRDPDAGACSVEGVIKTVQLADHLVVLVLEGGWASEVLACELEIVEEDGSDE